MASPDTLIRGAALPRRRPLRHRKDESLSVRGDVLPLLGIADERTWQLEEHFRRPRFEYWRCLNVHRHDLPVAVQEIQLPAIQPPEDHPERAIHRHLDG